MIMHLHSSCWKRMFVVLEGSLTSRRGMQKATLMTKKGDRTITLAIIGLRVCVPIAHGHANHSHRTPSWDWNVFLETLIWKSPHRKCPVYLGITQIVFNPPLSIGHSVVLFWPYFGTMDGRGSFFFTGWDGAGQGQNSTGRGREGV